MIRSLTLTIGALAVALVALIASSGTASAQESISVGDIFFCSPSFEDGVCTTTITEGDAVTWNFGGELAHTTTACGASCDAANPSPLWDSGVLNPGASFSFTFNDVGTFLYLCRVHPTEMRGQIVVQAAPPPTEPTEPPADGGDGGGPAPTTAPPDVAGPPTTGSGPAERSSPAWWLSVLASVGLGLALFGAGLRLARR